MQPYGNIRFPYCVVSALGAVSANFIAIPLSSLAAEFLDYSARAVQTSEYNNLSPVIAGVYMTLSGCWQLFDACVDFTSVRTAKKIRYRGEHHTRSRVSDTWSSIHVRHSRQQAARITIVAHLRRGVASRQNVCQAPEIVQSWRAIGGTVCQ